MLDLLNEFLKEKEWQFSKIDGKSIFIFGINGKNGNFQCIADINEAENKFSFFSICGARSPEDKKLIVIEQLNILNNNLFIGNFDLITENGEVRYKTSLDYTFIDVSKELLTQIIMVNINTMDISLPQIMGVMFGGQSPSFLREGIVNSAPTSK